MLAVSASALARSSARRRLLDAAAVRHARSGAHDPRGRKLDSSAKGRALIPAGGNQGVRSVHLFLPVHFRVIKIVLTTSRSLPGRAFTWGHPGPEPNPTLSQLSCCTNKIKATGATIYPLTEHMALDNTTHYKPE